jgi:hypothetical protein
MSGNQNIYYKVRINVNRDLLYTYYRDRADRYIYPNMGRITILSSIKEDKKTITRMKNVIEDPYGFFAWMPTIGQQILNSISEIVWDDEKFESHFSVKPENGIDIYNIRGTMRYIKINENETDIEYTVTIDFLANAPIFSMLPFVPMIKDFIINRFQENSKIMMNTLTNAIKDNK